MEVTAVAIKLQVICLSGNLLSGPLSSRSYVVQVTLFFVMWFICIYVVQLFVFFMSCSLVVIGAAVFFVHVLLLPFNFWLVVRSDFCLDGLHRYLVNSGDCSCFTPANTISAPFMINRCRDPWVGRWFAPNCSGHSWLYHGMGERVVLSVGLLAV